jgi:hypothetical protein
MNKREVILNTITDLVSDFLYYDRKEDEELGVGQIEAALQLHQITIPDIVDHFKGELIKGLID